MATLGTIVADFTTSLASAIAVGGTTGTLQSATDDDGVALPSGRYFFTIDGANANKEHISCQLSGTSLTSIKSVSRQGVETTGTARAHRLGATVTITDYLSIKLLNDMISGVATLDADVPLGYDATASITTDNQLATKAYVDGVAISGAPDAATGTKGITKLSVAAASAANPIAVGTNDPRIAPNNYGASAAGTDTYAITLSSAPSAYAAGQVYTFKADVANTGAATLNVNSLGAVTIKKNVSEDLATGDIAANQLVTVTYDGTNFQLSMSAKTTFVYTASGTWTKPAGAQAVTVIAIGGGAGGTTPGSGANDAYGPGGNGGGGGGYTKVTLPASILGSTETVTVGAGGAAGANGGASSFGTWAVAGGGTGMVGGTGTSPGTAGGAGANTGSSNSTAGTEQVGLYAPTGGGGGASAPGTGKAGGAITSFRTISGGAANGGTGVSATANEPSPGTGGGGGDATANGNGTNGGNGGLYGGGGGGGGGAGDGESRGTGGTGGAGIVMVITH